MIGIRRVAGSGFEPLISGYLSREYDTAYEPDGISWLPYPALDEIIARTICVSELYAYKFFYGIWVEENRSIPFKPLIYFIFLESYDDRSTMRACIGIPCKPKLT